MPVITNGVWVLHAWDRTLPVPQWTEQQQARHLDDVLPDMLRWRERGQQVRLDWVEDVPPQVGPEDFRIGTRH